MHISDRLYLAARLVCVVLALPLLLLTIMVGIMLLRGPGESPMQGVLVLVIGGGALSLVLFAALAPQRAASGLRALTPRPESVVRTSLITLAVIGLALPVISLALRAL